MNSFNRFEMECFYIGKVKIDPPLILAPLAEITDVYLRPLLKRIGGLGLVVTEMVSSEAIFRQNRRSYNAMTIRDDERPVSLQIYGSNPERMAFAAREAERLGVDIVDINFGCPARKVVRGMNGVALMRELSLAEEIIKAVGGAVDLPVTVKLRLGWDANSQNYIEFGKMAEGAGAQALALHARTGKMPFKGEVDRDAWSRLAESVNIPVMANGDIDSSDGAFAAIEKHGCAGAMIGRAALTNPFIFRKIFDQSRGREFVPAKREIGNYFIHYYNLISANPDRKFILHKLRIMGNWLSHGFENGSSFRRKLSSFKEVDHFISEIIEFFDPDDKLLPIKQKENIENDTVPVGN